MIELIVRKIFDTGLIAIAIAFLVPIFQHLSKFFIGRFGRLTGIVMYICSFCVIIVLFSNQSLHVYIAKKFIDQNGPFTTDVEFAIKILSSPILIDNKEAQTILYSLLFSKQSSDNYKAGTILWRLTKKGSPDAAIELGKAIDKENIDIKEFENHSEAIFYCFELGRCLGYNIEDDPEVYSKWRLLKNIVSDEISFEAQKICRDIKNEM